MSDITALEAIQAFLKERVASKMRLLKAKGEDINEYELVNPEVSIGWIPPKGYLPQALKGSVPCIIVGHDDGMDNGRQAEINIRIFFAVYNPGNYETLEDGSVIVTPNFEGYKDLLNLISKTKHELSKDRIINNTVTVQYPIRWKMYTNTPQHYWYGALSFKIRMKSTPYIPDILHQYF